MIAHSEMPDIVIGNSQRGESFSPCSAHKRPRLVSTDTEVCDETSQDPCGENAWITANLIETAKKQYVSPKRTPERKVLSSCGPILTAISAESGVCKGSILDKIKQAIASAESDEDGLLEIIEVLQSDGVLTTAAETKRVTNSQNPPNQMKFDSKAFYNHPHPEIQCQGMPSVDVKLSAQAALGVLQESPAAAFAAPLPMDMFNYQMVCLNNFMRRYNDFYHMISQQRSE